MLINAVSPCEFCHFKPWVKLRFHRLQTADEGPSKPKWLTSVEILSRRTVSTINIFKCGDYGSTLRVGRRAVGRATRGDAKRTGARKVHRETISRGTGAVSLSRCSNNTSSLRHLGHDELRDSPCTVDRTAHGQLDCCSQHPVATATTTDR